MYLLICLLSRICSNSITVSEETHGHPLQLKTASRTAYTCAGCQERGFGSSYQCVGENRPNSCRSYHLHNQCFVTAGSTTTHSLFSKKVKFTFHKQSPEHVGSCLACGKDVQGFRYQSPSKNVFGLGPFLPSKALVLHPCCFKLQDKRINNEGVNLQLKEKAPSKCLICQRKKISKKIEGWTYVSTCGEYCYRVKCVKDLVDKKLEQQSDGTNTSTLQLE